MTSEEIDPSTLDQYVLGGLSRPEMLRIQAAAVADADLRGRIEELEDLLWSAADQEGTAPPIELRGRTLLALEDAVLQAWASGRPPVMHAASLREDFAEWLDKPEHVLPEDVQEFHLVELDVAEDRQTGLVWLKYGYPEEVHTDCVERIMIVEGTCDVHIGDAITSLRPGDVITIPMHVPHHVRITSEAWCQAIVQRVAA